MKKTIALKENHEFRRLYHRGVSTAGKHVVIYCRRNKLGYNRLRTDRQCQAGVCGEKKPH